MNEFLISFRFRHTSCAVLSAVLILRGDCIYTCFNFFFSFTWVSSTGKNERQIFGDFKSKSKIPFYAIQSTNGGTVKPAIYYFDCNAVSLETKRLRRLLLGIRGENSKFGQNSGMHSKCTNKKIHTQTTTLANCQKSLILSDSRSLHLRKTKPFIDKLAKTERSFHLILR